MTERPATTPPRPDTAGETFQDQFTAEMADLGLRPPGKNAFSESEVDHERWVIDNPNDVVGLALSGGGIRSGIFNLGFLQGLADLDLLRHFHYLATVSGGGYIGGWWSTYRSRKIAAAKSTGSTEPPGSFPKPRFDGEEAREVHHLREFSRFLAPRWGFFELEMWQLFGALFTAMAPSLVVATSLLFVVLSTWLVLLFYAFTSTRPSLDVLLGLVTMAALFLLERGTARKEGVRNGLSANPFGYFLITGLTVGFAFLIPWLFPVIGAAAMDPTALAEEFASKRTAIDPVLFHPASVWLTLAAILIIIRFLFARAVQPAGSWCLRAPLDRIVARLLAMAVAWALGILVFGLVWYLQNDGLKATVAGILGVGSGGAFAWFRKLTARGPTKAKTGGVLEKVKLLTPRFLAFVAFAAAFVGTAYLVLLSLESGLFRETYIAAATIVILSLFIFAPNEVGLHAFYKARISRAFLGASNYLRIPWTPSRQGTVKPSVQSPNQESSEQQGDDILITELPSSGPFHLICCAANDLAGNPLTNLNRGARSAVISRLGFSVADSFYRWNAPKQKVISLGAALTASAAALDSNMGSKSVDYGFGAAFVMSALNLRLGLWLVPPQKLFDRILVGALFIEEMFGRTVADWKKGPVHLTDGGHFDNTALYELLRRHCRYIVVSDCGEDPDVLFDDLGNVLRRAREDFSVEIDVNFDVLKPNRDGFCAQHVAVGDIHYPNGDRGIIVIVKPGLVGEEPRDVLQYKSRNPRFPHESTGDQFYDEKQWESYRRLGSHAARTVFRFVQHYCDRQSLTRYELFGQVRQEWYPTPPGLAQASLDRSSTAEEIERQLASINCMEISRQIYPELPGVTKTLSAEETARFLPILGQMTQFMEDVYFSCQLEHHWNHPLNLGWTNYFARWATMPVFRSWWPLLNPMFSPKFVRFMDELFALPSLHGENTGLVLGASVTERVDPSGVAALLWKQGGTKLPDPSVVRTYTYSVTPGDGSAVDIGLAFVAREGDIARWARGDLWVPASFWGAGFEEDFLGRLLRVLAKRQATVALVTLPEPIQKDEGSQQRYADVLQMYRTQGFEIDGRTNDACVLQRAL
jgi:predicted acylesterase/phospholipase RssA